MPATSLLRPLALGALLGSLLGLTGCQSLLNSRYADSVHPDQGVVRIQGLGQNVVVRRNALGMPLIESNSFHDALFSMGYLHAADRLSQMVSMRLLAQGRLAELAGPGVLEVDRFMRAVNLRASAEQMYRNASPQLQEIFQVYARGVNAYLFRHRDKLPMDLAEAGHRPAYWQAEDSALLFCLLNFGLAANLKEEIAALLLAERVGSAQLAWLLPIYPDEALPFDEADKLAGLALHGQIPGLAQLQQTGQQLAGLQLFGTAASNNWAIAPSRSASGKTLLANDTHLPLSQPSLWNFMQIRAPRYQAAGVTLAGIPAVVAGFNGKLAWGMTMVMGDNQDLYLEQLREENGRLLYLADGQWLPTRERHETFFIKGQRPQREVIHETRNGPLLNSRGSERQHAMQPLPLNSRYGLALRHIQLEQDQTLDAFFALSRAQSVDQAHAATSQIRAMALNLVYADAQHIAWQVSGRFPNRRQGRGLLPSPGWDKRFAWDGYADPMLHPYDQDPPQGWLGTANQRSVPAGYGVQLSSSWYYPERAERIAQLAEASSRHDTRSMISMQYDQHSPFVGKLQAMFQAPGMAEGLQQAIAALPGERRARAEEALRRLLAFDGQLAAGSADAALYGAFLHSSAQEIFLDELGPLHSPAWQALVETANLSYSAQADHLLGREDSPFWNDQRTASQEDKPTILARSLAAAVELLEARLGSDRQHWQWGKLHSYYWRSDSSKLAAHLPASQRASVNALSGYLNRGPYPAGGDHSTLNVSAYAWGQDFDTWLIPAMRLIVDFGRDEPMLGLNSSGQSGNPASRHYADGIDAWRQGHYQSFPLRPENIDKVYGQRRLLLVPAQP